MQISQLGIAAETNTVINAKCYLRLTYKYYSNYNKELLRITIA